MARARFELIRPDWPAPAHVRAVSTTRSGGFSTGGFASLNLGTHVGDDVADVERNRMLLSEALDYGAVPRWLDQVHGTDVISADQCVDGATADAAITLETGIACTIMTADCLPVLFSDREGTIVAAAHGGWRGLVGGILENTVLAFVERGVSPGELLAWLGPAIGPAAYEVDQAVISQLTDADRPALQLTDAGHAQLDLYALARTRLARAGVGNIFGGDFCTFSDAERFFSYRRDGICGRQATLIWLEPV